MDEGNKCNIEFAADAFQFIINNKQRKLSVIVADVTSFLTILIIDCYIHNGKKF